MHWSAHHWRSKLQCPQEEVKDFVSLIPDAEDVAGVAGHIVRLCAVYNLTLSHVLDGQVMGLSPVRPMNMKECFFVVDAAYQMIDAKEHQKWQLACQQVKAKAPLSLAGVANTRGQK